MLFESKQAPLAHLCDYQASEQVVTMLVELRKWYHRASNNFCLEQASAKGVAAVEACVCVREREQATVVMALAW